MSTASDEPPTLKLVKALEGGKYQSLCPNRIWHVWQALGESGKESLLDDLESFGTVMKEALSHEDHSACNFEFCEFSSRNFTAVKQYHEPRPSEEDDQTDVAKRHENKDMDVCFPLRDLFNEERLVEAVKSDQLTAWGLDGSTILEHPRPFMAISHVWSDGTGTGTWPSKQVNECLYSYFKGVAERFHCEGIWWDTLCVPQDRKPRSKALRIMHRNYEYARITLVHDRFLRNLSFEKPRLACFAIVMSPWFTRGWTALELAKSRKVKIVFKDSIKDLDIDILEAIEETPNVNGITARGIIKNLRTSQIDSINDLLAVLGPRYTSWAKDRAAIAGLLAGVPLPMSDKDTFQQDTYQEILKRMGKVSHEHLFHRSVTMSGGFDWCAANLFKLPRAKSKPELHVCQNGDVIGDWIPFLIAKTRNGVHVYQKEPRNQEEISLVWGDSHSLIEAKLKNAVEKEIKTHRLLVVPHKESEEITTGVLVKVFKHAKEEGFKCQFVGSLQFKSPLQMDNPESRSIRIGHVEGWYELNDNEKVWDIMGRKPNNEPTPSNQGHTGSQSRDQPEWPMLHHVAWLRSEATEKGQRESGQLGLRDGLGQTVLHLAAERGHHKILGFVLEKESCHVNKPDHNGQTPLHRAAWGGSLETVRFLTTRHMNDLEVLCATRQLLIAHIHVVILNGHDLGAFEDEPQRLWITDEISITPESIQSLESRRIAESVHTTGLL